MIADEVRVIFRKYDGRPHRHSTMRRLGEDGYGTWLAAPAGAVVHMGGGGHFVAWHRCVRLVPRSAWWSALFFPAPAEWDAYCDVTTPARWASPVEVTMTDLDLDVYRTRADRRVEVLDEDEFAVHRDTYGYPAEVVGNARAAVRDLRAALSGGTTEPFATWYRTWLDQAPPTQ
jgi:hypothetical protein